MSLVDQQCLIKRTRKVVKDFDELKNNCSSHSSFKIFTVSEEKRGTSAPAILVKSI